MKRKIFNLVAVMLLAAATFVLIPKNAKAEDQTLQNTYASVFGKIGTCVSSWQLNDANVVKNLKVHFNSITMENEMKPSALMDSGGWWGGGSATLISVEEAKNRGYYIPENYKDSQVPSLNFNTTDSIMKLCYDNGLGLRGHCLVWHSQTPDWFFKQNFNGNGGDVSREVMNARLEFYIKSVLNHVYKSRYGECVYAWDVVNEHFHNNGQGGWRRIYGNEGARSEYISNAFKYAYEALEDLGIAGSVGLFYNDYNEYEVTQNMVDLVNYINRDKKYCTGVGMQSHLAITYPSVDDYIKCLKKFLDSGFEVQITEFDATNNNEGQQAQYIYDLFKRMLQLKKNGANISAFVMWGLSDRNSWRGNQTPLLFSNTNVPKQSYNRAMQAFEEVYGVKTMDAPGPVRITPVDPSKITPSPVPPSPSPIPVDISPVRTEEKMVVDGKADDAAWKAASTKSFVNYSRTKGTTTGEAKVMWDDKNLYVFVDVTDPSIDKSSRNAWNRDGIEIFFDEDFSAEYSYSNDKDAFQYRFTGLSPDGSAAETSEFVSSGSEAATRYAALTKNIKYVVTSKGYSVECAIPFYTKPAKWQYMGFDITIMDCEGGNRNNEIWLNGPNKSNLYQQPSLMGIMKLGGLPGEVEPAPTPGPGATPDPSKDPDKGGTKDDKTSVKASDAEAASGSAITIAAPKKVKAVLKSKKVKLSWKKVKGASKYVIYRATKKNGKFKKIKVVKKNKYTDRKIKGKKSYYYKVQVIKVIDGKNRKSGYSKAVKAKKAKKSKKTSNVTDSSKA